MRDTRQAAAAAAAARVQGRVSVRPRKARTASTPRTLRELRRQACRYSQRSRDALRASQRHRRRCTPGGWSGTPRQNQLHQSRAEPATASAAATACGYGGGVRERRALCVPRGEVPRAEVPRGEGRSLACVRACMRVCARAQSMASSQLISTRWYTARRCGPPGGAITPPPVLEASPRASPAAPAALAASASRRKRNSSGARQSPAQPLAQRHSSVEPWHSQTPTPPGPRAARARPSVSVVNAYLRDRAHARGGWPG